MYLNLFFAQEVKKERSQCTSAAGFSTLIAPFPQSYMEDHLAHKDRMNKEWESLTTYEADPRCVEAGSKLENLIKNRYPDVLPCKRLASFLNPSPRSLTVSCLP